MADNSKEPKSECQLLHSKPSCSPSKDIKRSKFRAIKFLVVHHVHSKNIHGGAGNWVVLDLTFYAFDFISISRQCFYYHLFTDE